MHAFARRSSLLASERCLGPITIKLPATNADAEPIDVVAWLPTPMARPNYSGEKRRKELEKQRKKAEKKQRKLDNAAAGQTSDTETETDAGTETTERPAVPSPS